MTAPRPPAFLSSGLGACGPSVSADYAQALRAFLRTGGLDERHNPASALLAHAPARRIGGTAFADALIAGGRELGVPAPGLAFGDRIGGAGFGLLGIVAATGPTLLEATAHLSRFESITSTMGQMRLRRCKARADLVWSASGGPPAPAVVESILASWVSFGRYLLGEAGAKGEVTEVCFAHPRMAPSAYYEQILACPVRFGADEYRVRVAADLLDAPSRFAEPRINAALTGWLDRRTAMLTGHGRPLTRSVAELLSTRLALADADENAAARLLGLTRRTLQRHLACEGARFRDLLDAARAEHAIGQVLRGHVALAELGADIGFAEQSSLSRAFRRWTAYAPRELRQRLDGLFHELRPGVT